MKKNSLRFATLILAVLFLASTTTAHAFGNKGKQCPMGGMAGSESGKGFGSCPITDKLMKKAHFYLSSQKDLGLSDEQVTRIKQIKLDAEKASVQKTADMKLFQLDLQNLLAQSPIDEAVAGALIDKNTAAMASGAKEMVSSFAKLKAVLTAEQMEKVKALWKTKEHSEKKKD